MKEEVSKYKKHHAKLTEVPSKKYKFNKEEEYDINEALDPFAFEKYCGSCVNFETEDCPLRDKVNSMTRWRTDVSCNKFYD